MSNLSNCALCNKDAELKLSHIIPKFVFRYLKKDSFTGRLRNALDPNIALQDGDKEYLLCGECEGLLSKGETKFSNKFFQVFKKEGFSRLDYNNSWLNYFVTSVNWRTLYLDIDGYEKEEDIKNKISTNQLSFLKKAEQIMRQYLQGERRDLDFIENHIFFFDTIKSIENEDHNLTTLHSLIQGSAFGYTVHTQNGGVYVFANLSGIFIITILKKEKKEKWRNTFIKNEKGRIKSPQYSNSTVFSEIYYIAEQREHSYKRMSEKQKHLILDKAKQDVDGFKKSGSYQRIIKDSQISFL